MMPRCGTDIGMYLFRLIVIVSSATATGVYQLTVPSTYTAFSGDLHVGYHVPPNVSISKAYVAIFHVQGEEEEQQQEEQQKQQLINTVRLPSAGQNTGRLLVLCGVLEYAGTYVVKMYMFANGPVLTQTTFRVVWPRFNLILPDHLFAMTSSVALDVVSEATCGPKIHRESFFIEFYFKRRAANLGYLPLDTSQLIKTVSYTSISNGSTMFTYPCDLFDLDGSYQAVLKSTFNSGSIIRKSAILNVTWSTRYSIKVRSKSIFPCTRTVTVIYSQLPCARKGLQDTIRLYELQRTANGSLAAPLKQKYILERHVNPYNESFSLSCRFFNRSSAGYCFKYFSNSRSGAVALQTHLCLSTHPDADFYVDGDWSVWSEWSDCTVTCGSGKRNRFRICNNPAPLHGGKFCAGDPIEWKDCSRECPGFLPEGPLKSPKINVECACGCPMTLPSGEIIASGRCSGHAVWTIVVAHDKHIRLSFSFFNIMTSKQWVKVRDGDTLDSDILFASSSGDPSDDVTSSTNKMIVELRTEPTINTIAIFPINASLPIHIHGFIATYQTLEAGGGPLASTIIRRSQSSILDSKVAIVGIALCVLIVFVVIAFVTFHRLYHKRHKYAMAASDSPVHIARSTSMHSSRASSPPPGITNVDIEAPLTGDNNKKKESIVSRGSSISSTCSAGFKKLRSKAESVTGSPKPSTKNYSPLPSPYTANSPPEEFLHDANFFKASPNLKNMRPRSPKIHPSPKLKHSPMAASPSSPTKTKHELLTKKRQEQLNMDTERIVTGSSGSSKDVPVAKLAVPETPTPTSSLGHRSVLPVRDGISSARTPGDKTPQNEVIIMASLREEQNRLKGDEKYPDADQETTSFIQPSVKARRPTSLTGSYSSESIGAKPKVRTEKAKKNDTKRPSAMEERQSLLPKPDGQSPKSPTREEHSKSSTPRSTKSSRSSKSALNTSPTKSLNTPSEIASVDLELEYDDFIDDDPLSYFQLEELQKLRWQGGERIGRHTKDDH